MPLSSSSIVGVQHQVTVTSKELSIGGRVHRHFVASFHSPNLHKHTHSVTYSLKCVECTSSFLSSLCPYLDFSRAVIHHAMLSSHGAAAVEFGGVEGHLLYLGDAADGVNLTRTCLVPFQPFKEKLLEQGGLAPCWYHLDLSVAKTQRC